MLERLNSAAGLSAHLIAQAGELFLKRESTYHIGDLVV